ncbi:MAG: hypothetical protein AAF411_27720 [Myxococcota bacterium]
MTVVERLAGAAALLLAATTALSNVGCICNEGRQVFEDFEDFCGDAPCGWDASGPVRRTQSFHPSLSSVAIAAGTTLSATVPADYSVIDVLVRCDEGARLVGFSDPPTNRFEWRMTGVGDFDSQDDAVIAENDVELTVEGEGECIIDDVARALISCE